MDKTDMQTDRTEAGVLVAMSGGVDSSVAALRMVECGMHPVGVTLRMPSYGADDGSGHTCCGLAAIEDARRVCHRLGIRHYVFDYRRRFEQTVLEDFLTQYGSGRTPNPCIRCNEWLKFGALLETAAAMDAPSVVTGHYVRRRWSSDAQRCELLTGVDGEDQSYFLFSLSQNQLAHALFPLGDMTKEEVRLLALKAGLRTHDRPKSQDLCFLPQGHYADLIRRRRPELLAPGDIVHVSGRRLGTHRGVAFYTVGQRKGLGIAAPDPLYVVAIDAAQNRIVVGEKEHTMNRHVVVDGLNWIMAPPPSGDSLRATVKIRFRHPGAAARVDVRPDGTALVTFDEAQTAPTPGQAAVLYDRDRVLGGGFIRCAGPAPTPG